MVTKERVIFEQNKDQKLKNIIEKIRESGTDQIVLSGQKYILRGLLYREVQNKYLVMVPNLLADDILHFLHISSLHRGATALNQSLKNSNFLIENKTKRIQKITRDCLYCQMTFHNKFKRLPELDHKIRPALRPLQKISIDLLDISYGNKNCYLLTFLCCYSTFFENTS